MIGRKELLGPSNEILLAEQYALLTEESKLMFLILASNIFRGKNRVILAVEKLGRKKLCGMSNE
jgi:hypothetical protein